MGPVSPFTGYNRIYRRQTVLRAVRVYEKLGWFAYPDWVCYNDFWHIPLISFGCWEKRNISLYRTGYAQIFIYFFDGKERDCNENRTGRTIGSQTRDHAGF